MLNRKQIIRMVKFISEMKQNNYPNAQDFVKLLKRYDLEDNENLLCSSRTIMRDIKILIDDFKAPIEYDSQQRGFFLKNPSWEFSAPILPHEKCLDAVLLSSRLTLDILPSKFQKRIEESIEQTLSHSEKSVFFDKAMIQTIINASGIKSEIDSNIFEQVFNGWRQHISIKFDYKNPQGKNITIDFAPHIMAFHKGNWYVKGYEANTKNIRVFAIHRIINVEKGRYLFDPCKQLYKKTQKDGLFNYEKLADVKLKCDSSTAFYFYEHQKIKKFKIEEQSDKSLIITLQPAIEHEVIRFVLGEQGRIEVISHPELREKIKKAAEKIVNRHG